MFTVAIISPDHDLRPLAARLQSMLADARVAVWPEDDISDAEIAICWEPPKALLHTLPRLRLVHGVAAGVDNLIDLERPGSWKICRVVDPQQPVSMEQYVLWAVLYFHRHFDRAIARQSDETWLRTPYTAPSQCRIGVMGLGEIGLKVAEALARRGYSVRGWSRTARNVQHVEVFVADEYAAFLADTDILVCLLPLTPETKGILDRRTFAALPQGAALVHVGRGDHLVPADLIDALQSGHLRGAVLDVFSQEPLPAHHPLWSTPGVLVTPHMATMADHGAVIEQVLANIGVLRRGGTDLINEVDPARGY